MIWEMKCPIVVKTNYKEKNLKYKENQSHFFSFDLCSNRKSIMLKACVCVCIYVSLCVCSCLWICQWIEPHWMHNKNFQDNIPNDIKKIENLIQTANAQKNTSFLHAACCFFQTSHFQYGTLHLPQLNMHVQCVWVCALIRTNLSNCLR